ncbi:MAG: transglutaminase-like domain-containing protein [Betaproteobacteria bacterium]
MPRRRLSATGARAFALAALVALAGGCASTADYFKDAGRPAATAPLEAWPHRELWTGIVFNGQKVGFTRRAVRAAPGAPGRYEIESEAAIRLRFLGFDKRVSLRALDRVRADLTLESFRYSHDIDGSRLEVFGAADGRALRFTVQAAGSETRKTLQLGEPLYPSSVLTMLPAMRGLAVGAQARYSVFNGETQSVEQAEQEVLAYETSQLFEGAAFRTVTRLMGLETVTWLAADGRPLLERGLNGVMISALESEAAAKSYLLEASLSRREALVDFSLLPAGPLEAPRRLSGLSLVIDDMPDGFAVPSEGGQSCARSGARLECRIDRSAPLAQGEPKRHLAATLAAPSDLGQIRELSGKIVAGERDPDRAVSLLLSWIEDNIAKEAIDAFTAVDVLRERRAECQGHAYLLAALARAAGIPARIVNGIAYSEAHRGFLYHTWNELWIDGRGWRPVDATFGQAHADATHLKLIEGEAAADLLPLLGLVGRIRVVSAAPLSRW